MNENCIIVLVGPSGNTMCPFPCPIFIERTEVADGEDEKGRPIIKTNYDIICNDNLLIARYSAMAPAKLELDRLRKAWNQVPSLRPHEFQFLKES